MGQLSRFSWWAIGFVTAANLSILASVYGIWVSYLLVSTGSILIIVDALYEATKPARPGPEVGR